MNPRPIAPVLLAAAGLLLSSCPRPVPAGAGVLEEASRQVLGGSDGARERALAGFAAYLLETRPEAAEALFNQALEDEEDPWALYGLAEMARRKLDTPTRARAALRLVRRSPRGPLAAVAARIAVAHVGQTPGLDAEIEQAALEALEAGAEGDAAFLLRRAAAVVRQNRGDEEGARKLLADSGAMRAARLLGPWSPYQALEWDRAFPPERGELAGQGPRGPVLARDFESPDGRYQLHAEPGSADVYYWAADLTVPEKATYQLRAAGNSTFAVFLDGVRVLERRAFAAWLPEEMTAEVRLPSGRHRLLAKVARGSQSGEIFVALSRADGEPAGVTFRPAQGPAPRAEKLAIEPVRSSWPDAASLARALEPEVGRALAAFVAARDALFRDTEGTKALVEELSGWTQSAALRVLKAELEAADRSLPERLGRGRSQRDLEAAVQLDPGEASALQRLSVNARGDGQLDRAAEWLARAAQAAVPESWRVLISQMRLAQAQGADSLVDQHARRALASEPRLCEALFVRFDLARRFEAARQADALIQVLEGCPGALRARADHLRQRGELEKARELLLRLARASPADPSPRLSLANLAFALNRPQEAAQIAAELSRQWPFSTSFMKLRADALERAGDHSGARAERERALKQDGSDLTLRRALAYLDGTEVLGQVRHDGQAFLEQYRSEAPAETAAGVYVLDSCVVQAHPDGSFTDRTHMLTRVSDQRGVGQFAEVHLPASAQVLVLRTIKKDGRILEPEAIGGKDGISLPGVEVGDFVEVEFLSSTPSRGPVLPGFVAPKFYFRIVDAQVYRSYYEVRAPEGEKLEVDAHSMEAPLPTVEGGVQRLVIERADVPPFVHEPGGPSRDELLSFVQVGSGAGNAEMATHFGDLLVDRWRPSQDLARFAREAARGKTGLEAVKAVYDRVMAEVKGAEGGPTVRATATLAQGRGSRISLMKAALAVLGIESRVALVRPFSADPAPYRFPASGLYSEAVLLVRLGEQPLFLAPGTRFAPFGRLPPELEGQEALVLPEPGERASTVRTPIQPGEEGKRIAFDLALAADGTLSGSGEETYLGFEAAELRAGLERLDEDRRRQAIEAAVARSFDGARLHELAVEEPQVSGAPVVIRYRFTAPRFARGNGRRLTLEKGIFTANLARRHLALSERKTPLLLADTERLELSTRLRLPEGMALASELVQTRLETPFGQFERSESADEGALLVRERLLRPRQRVLPEQYAAFGEFLSAIDEAQRRELVLEAAALPAPAPGG